MARLGRSYAAQPLYGLPPALGPATVDWPATAQLDAASTLTVGAPTRAQPATAQLDAASTLTVGAPTRTQPGAVTAAAGSGLTVGAPDRTAAGALTPAGTSTLTPGGTQIVPGTYPSRLYPGQFAPRENTPVLTTATVNLDAASGLTATATRTTAGSVTAAATSSMFAGPTVGTAVTLPAAS